MQIVAVVLEPEFHTALKGVQVHGLGTALMIDPMGTLLIENCNWAGDEGLTEATQAETL
mgnify:CR=1 FL=1